MESSHRTSDGNYSASTVFGLNLIFTETSEWFDDDELEWLLAGADDGDGAVPFS